MSPARALLSLHVAVLLFGLAALFARWVSTPPEVLVLGRTAFAAATLALVMIAARQPIGAPSAVFAVNAVVLALHWLAFFAAVQRGGVATALLGYATFPLWVVLLEALRDRQLRGRELTVAAIVVGALLLLAHEQHGDAREPYALALGVVSGATFAALVIVTRHQTRTHSPLAIALWQNAGAALLLVGVMVLRGAVPALGARDIVLLGTLGVLCTALAHTLFIQSLTRVSAHTASVAAALEPVYGITLALLLLGEVPSLQACVAGVLLVGAAVAATDAFGGRRA